MSDSNPIAWQDLRGEFGFTPEEEAEMAAGRERLLSQVRATTISTPYEPAVDEIVGRTIPLVAR